MVEQLHFGKFELGHFDSQVPARLGRVRENFLDMASTTPVEGLYDLMKSMTDFAIYPEHSIDYVKELDTRFNEDFFDHIFRYYNRLETGKSTSVLPAIYFLSRDFIAPVRNLFSLHLAKEFRREDDHIHFLARDGLVEYTSSLLFQDSGIAYPDFNYVPLSVKLVRLAEDPIEGPKVKTYLDQKGFAKPGRHVLVDIGFTGEIPDRLAKLYPDTDFEVRFLISKANPQIITERPVMAKAKGFLFDEMVPNAEQSFRPAFRLYQTPVIRGLEDTWSGVSTSSTGLIVGEEGKLTTNSREYAPSYDRIRRELALRGVIDATKLFIYTVQSGDMTYDELLKYRSLYAENLGQMLLFHGEEKLFIDLMAEHEATNKV